MLVTNTRELAAPAWWRGGGELLKLAPPWRPSSSAADVCPSALDRAARDRALRPARGSETFARRTVKPVPTAIRLAASCSDPIGRPGPDPIGRPEPFRNCAATGPSGDAANDGRSAFYTIRRAGELIDHIDPRHQRAARCWLEYHMVG
jgi:hypothetical protein